LFWFNFYLRLKGLTDISVYPKGHTVRQGPDCLLKAGHKSL
jgi:hypothetical protein